jgi:hypothetical protein
MICSPDWIAWARRPARSCKRTLVSGNLPEFNIAEGFAGCRRVLSQEKRLDTFLPISILQKRAQQKVTVPQADHAAFHVRFTPIP